MANSIPKIIYDAGAGDVTITFEFPALGMDFEGKSFKAVAKVTESANGNYQTSEGYIEEERNFKYKQVKESIKTDFETFFLVHGIKGKAFKYFIHSDEVEFLTVKISKRARRFRPKRTGWNASNDFTYEFSIRMRRVI